MLTKVEEMDILPGSIPAGRPRRTSRGTVQHDRPWKNKERGSGTYGNVKNRKRIRTGSSKMEEDHLECDPNSR